MKKNYLEIRKDSPLYKPFLFLSKAREKDSWKPVYEKVWVKDNEFVVTDGKRYHYLYCEGLSLNDGIYDISVSKESIILLDSTINIDQFPDWKRVTPKDEDLEKAPFDIVWKGSKARFTQTDTDNIFNIYSILGIKLNLEFLRDLKLFPKWELFYHASMPTSKPVIFSQKSDKIILKVAIMPMTV